MEVSAIYHSTLSNYDNPKSKMSECVTCGQAVKMPSSSRAGVCKRCNRIFQSGERKRLLQNYPSLCESVFSSGPMDIIKLIDVSQLDNPVCYIGYQYFSRQLRAKSGNQMKNRSKYILVILEGGCGCGCGCRGVSER